jgi:hypothetical protein
MKTLWIDFETCSAAELGGKDSVGLYNYATHPSTKILMMAYKLLGSKTVELWQPHLESRISDDLYATLHDPVVMIGAFNSAFERYLLQYKLGITIPASRFVDPQVGCRYLSLPPDLDSCCSILGLPAHLAKDKRGEELIKLFSLPQLTRKKKGEEQRTYFNDWQSHPREWAEFGEYCFVPKHKLLGEDLLWKPAYDFKVGDVVLGFDETGPHRKFRRAKIEAISFEYASVFEVRFESGKTFVVTKEHQWLTCRKRTKGSKKSSQRLRWLETKDLESKECNHGNGWSSIPRLISPWSPDTSYEAGWLAGILDGEGSYSGNHLSIGQNPGLVQNRIREGLSQYVELSSSPTVAGRRCETIHIKGHKLETLRVLGQIRPIRLLAKVNFDTLGQLECRDIRDGVVSVKSVGVQQIIKIQTSTGTLVVDGYPMHNCKQDVTAEEEVMRRLEILDAWPMPPFERKLWEFDQTVNDRGMPVDRDFVEKAYRLAIRSKQEALEAQNAITGLENSNSTKQLLPWAKARGYTYNTLNKNFVDAALKDPDVKMTEECRKVLTARREAASTAYTKLAAILRQVCDDGRLRNQFIYLGSSRCGRWSGSSVQLHNLARPMVLGKCPENPDGYDFENEDVLNDARALVYGENYDVIKARYKSVLLTIKCLIRTVFVAPRMS